MKRVLVTGASGFIGRHALAPLAARGYEVHAVARTPPAGSGNIHWHTADLLDAAQAQRLIAQLRPSHLLHFAWYAEHGKFWSAPENHAWVEASKVLLQAFAENGGRRFVGAGTCAEYDWSAGECVENHTALRPGNLYGACKDEFRRHLDELAKTSGLRAAWGRIFHLYGPDEHPARLVASVIAALRKGEPAASTHGEQLRDFMHVSDVAAAFAALLDSEANGAVNIASGQPVKLREVIARIGALMGRESLLRIGALPTREGDPPVLTASVARLREEVGWRPALDLDAGLAQTIRIPMENN